MKLVNIADLFFELFYRNIKKNFFKIGKTNIVIPNQIFLKGVETKRRMPIIGKDIVHNENPPLNSLPVQFRSSVF